MTSLVTSRYDQMAVSLVRLALMHAASVKLLGTVGRPVVRKGASFGAARMILGCAEGRSTTVGTDLGVSAETVGKWRSRFLERRLDGLSDEPRSGRPRAVTDDDVERVITLTLGPRPGTRPIGATVHGPAPG